MKYDFVKGKMLETMNNSIELMPERPNKHTIAGKDIAALAENMKMRSIDRLRQTGSHWQLAREDYSECYYVYSGFDNRTSTNDNDVSVGGAKYSKYDIGPGKIQKSTIKDIIGQERISSVVMTVPTYTLLSALDEYRFLSSIACKKAKMDNSIQLSDVQLAFEDYDVISQACYSNDDTYLFQIDRNNIAHETYVPPVDCISSNELGDDGITHIVPVPGFSSSITGSYVNSYYPDDWTSPYDLLQNDSVFNGIHSRCQFSYKL